MIRLNDKTVAIPVAAPHGATVYALVDPADAEAVSRYTWRLTGRGYAARTEYGSGDGTRRKVLMHRELLGLERDDPRETDHKNLDRLDNRRRNLHAVTPAVNAANRDLYSSNTSGFRGVRQHKVSGRWHAHAQWRRENFSLGYHDTPEEAAAHVAMFWAAVEAGEDLDQFRSVRKRIATR